MCWFIIISDEIFNLIGKKINIHECRAGKLRLNALHLDTELYNYYSKHDISDPENIILDVDLLKFQNYKETDIIILRQMSIDLIYYLNNKLDNNRDVYS